MSRCIFFQKQKDRKSSKQKYTGKINGKVFCIQYRYNIDKEKIKTLTWQNLYRTKSITVLIWTKLNLTQRLSRIINNLIKCNVHTHCIQYQFAALHLRPKRHLIEDKIAWKKIHFLFSLIHNQYNSKVIPYKTKSCFLGNRILLHDYFFIIFSYLTETRFVISIFALIWLIAGKLLTPSSIKNSNSKTFHMQKHLTRH